MVTNPRYIKKISNIGYKLNNKIKYYHSFKEIDLI